MEIVDHAADGLEALDKTSRLKPDVLLLDLSMPKKPGLAVFAELRAASPATRILVLTMHDDPAYLKAVLAAGGAGYLVKRAAHAELLSAIRSVHAGRSFIGITLASDSLREVVAQQAADKPKAGRPTLSRREREVLQKIAQGYSARQIAAQLDLSEKTVETYRGRIAEKFELRHRADLVRLALEMGLLSTDES
jgi:two-component system response regulator NreC